MAGRCGCGKGVCSCVVKAKDGTGNGTVVTGTGTTDDPYLVSSQEYALTVEDTGSVDLTLTGTGYGGDADGSNPDPWVVSGVVKPSTDANNCAQLGTDGGVFVACGATGGTTVSGGDGITVSPDGAGGFNIETDPGCGLEHSATGQIQVATSGTWPLADLYGTDFPTANETCGGAIYCDSTGQLRGLPDHTIAVASAPDTSPALGNRGVGTYTVSETAFAVINNPSQCRSMIGQCIETGEVNLNASNRVLTNINRLRNDTITGMYRGSQGYDFNWTPPGVLQMTHQLNRNNFVNRFIAPGTTFQAQVRLDVVVQEGTVIIGGSRTGIGIVAWTV